MAADRRRDSRTGYENVSIHEVSEHSRAREEFRAFGR